MINTSTFASFWQRLTDRIKGSCRKIAIKWCDFQGIQVVKGFEDPVGKKDGRVVVGWPRGHDRKTFHDSLKDYESTIPRLRWSNLHGPAADLIGEDILRRFDNEMMSDFISENMIRDLFVGKMAGFVVWLDDEDRIQVSAFGREVYGEDNQE